MAAAGFCAALLLTLPGLVSAQPGDLYRGRVLGVIDGGTLRVARYGGGELRVRLPVAPGRDKLLREYDGHRITIEEIRWDKGFLYGQVSDGDGWPDKGVMSAQAADGR